MSNETLKSESNQGMTEAAAQKLSICVAIVIFVIAIVVTVIGFPSPSKWVSTAVCVMAFAGLTIFYAAISTFIGMCVYAVCFPFYMSDASRRDTAAD